MNLLVAMITKTALNTCTATTAIEALRWVAGVEEQHAQVMSSGNWIDTEKGREHMRLCLKHAEEHRQRAAVWRLEAECMETKERDAEYAAWAARHEAL